MATVCEGQEIATLKTAGGVGAVTIRSAGRGDDMTAFRVLNEEWITKFFALEPKDREVLNNPEEKILAKGGRVFLARIDGEEVGCVALIPMGEEVFELSKMAVSPRAQGKGIGRQLLLRCLAEAREMGAKSLFLGSNSKLKNAVHLYESVGFRHVPEAELPPMDYARADVFMDLKL
ncbi:GNAT family N-acetyltransferase [Granulicella sp. 5B5]|uniref:GNAT family N-acetyltransferase n=1 Tax=Granulicella sp. 5B5 TaxID=1617967 RepID=UPI0015F5FC72|nr:GNAT family N-acetyltransferase [Granulicella sp. 5B5]QMV19624.1 GNAT family N-acetyltransferase [Granulicella sp. 5B5]